MIIYRKFSQQKWVFIAKPTDLLSQRVVVIELVRVVECETLSFHTMIPENWMKWYQLVLIIASDLWVCVSR